MAPPCLRAYTNIYMRCHVECGAFTGDGLTKYIRTDAKLIRDAKFGRKNRFEIKIETEDQCQSIPKSIGTLTVVRCIFGPSMKSWLNGWWLMARTNSQAQNGINFDFEVEFDLEGHGQSPPKTIVILTKVSYTFGPNLAILAWTGPELSRGQASDWRTDWHTHTRTHTHRRRRWQYLKAKTGLG